MNNKLYRIVCDDWEVLYGIDGKKICEGHKIPWDKWFKIGQQNPEMRLYTIYLSEKTQYEYDLWDFPYEFNDLPIEIQNSLFKESKSI